MAAENMAHEMPSGEVAPPGSMLKDTSLLEDVRALWHEIRLLSQERFRLAALETQQLGISLVNMVMAGVLVAGLLCGAWMGLLAAAVLGMVEDGMMARNAILLAALLNLLLALVFCRAIRHMARYLKFPATLESLQPTSPEQKDTGNP